MAEMGAGAKTETYMNLIKRFQRQPCMTGARVSLKTFEDPDHGLHTVIVSLPSGMDIAPDIFRFARGDDAQNKFNSACARLEKMGFNCVETASV